MIPVAIAIFTRNLNSKSVDLWMQIRRENGPLDGLLEFPGGKIELGESSIEACKREVEEEVGVDVPLEQFVQFKIHQHHFKDRSVLLSVFISNFDSMPESEEGKWFEFDFEKKSSAYEGRLPEVNFEIVDQLLSYLQRQSEAGFSEKIWDK